MKAYPSTAATVFLAVTLALCSSCARTLVVAVDPTFAPLEIRGQSGELTGFDIDVMKAIAKEAGFKVKFQEKGFATILEEIGAGKFDAAISSISILEERKQKMDFSEPYLQVDEVVFVSASSTEFKDLPELSGKAVGTVKGFSALEMAAGKLKDAFGTKTQFLNSLEECMRNLSLGTISGFIFDGTLQWVPELRNTIRIIGQPVLPGFYGIAVRKGDTRTLDLINKGLKRVQASGKIDEMKKRWLK
jgi:ABC-type amino acid transport substrate-binding protein